jgi:hypothetical protein
MRRKVLLVIAVVVLVGAAATAGVLAGRSAAGPFRPAAHKQARQLLNQLALPPGAQRLSVAPRGDGSLLRQAQSIPSASQLIDLHRIWRVHRASSSTASFVEHHLPRGAHGEITGGAVGGPGIPPNNQEFSYSMPTRAGLSVTWLDLTFVALPQGWTGIRADALVGRCPCLRH